MSSKLILTVASGLPNEDAVKMQVVTGKHAMARKVLNYLESVQVGNQLAYDQSLSIAPSILVENQGSMVKASGTFTLSSVVATNTCSVNGVTFTAIASGATGNQFNVGVDDTETAVNLAAAINASVSALVSGYVSASSALAVVTVSSSFFGTAGNQATIVGSANIVASGARLASGAADAAAVTISF